ncbi:HNH endonuclease [Paracoccus sp. NGMCC 1.201697]|uniref:HNH endonuclease n=1 Tax=Paracoccus broussonetiae subsp. drimophilus TaxID=3373869 RepID=A0ABW7LGV9_9RHOB
MSCFVMDYALKNTIYRGEARLAYIAAGDNDGRISVTGICYWCGCDAGEAEAIIDRMIECGIFRRLEGRVVCPELVAVAEENNAPTPRSQRRQFTVSTTRRARLYARDGNACHYCGGGENLTLDHMLPQSRGGDDSDENLVTCCRNCNSSKGTKTYDEFLAWLEVQA